jgi:hypothetical protein
MSYPEREQTGICFKYGIEPKDFASAHNRTCSLSGQRGDLEIEPRSLCVHCAADDVRGFGRGDPSKVTNSTRHGHADLGAHLANP